MWVALGILLWGAWAVLVSCLLVELAAAVRGIHAPELRGLSRPQHAARVLVAWAALLFVAAPTAPAAFPAPAAHALAPDELPGLIATAPPRTDAAGTASVATVRPVAFTAPATPVPAARQPVADVPGTVPYTVMRGDSLWKIAEKMLGDPLRYPEIAALNADALGGEPDFIAPPMVLLLPDDARTPAAADADAYTVKPGDTLSQIALDELGDAARYPEIFEASTDTIQPGGEKLTDPDLIKPGWELDLPDDDAAAGAGPETSSAGAKEPVPADEPASPRPSAVAKPPAIPVPPPSAAPSPPPAQTNPPTEADEFESQDTEDIEDDTAPAAWLLPGLTGAGALLGGALFIGVRARMRKQVRFRRPGMRIAPPPPELVSAERTATIVGRPRADMMEALDAYLCALGSHYEGFAGLPRLDAVEIAESTAVLHLTDNQDLPAPWTGRGKTWSALLDTEPDRDTASLTPPWPLLTSVGTDDAGHAWLLNLEQMRTITITGDAEHAEALARYIAADIALSRRGVCVSIVAAGVAREVATTGLERITYVTADDQEPLHHFGTSSSLDSGTDPDGVELLLITAQSPHLATIREKATAIRAATDRAGATIVTLHGRSHDHDAVLDLTPDGRLLVPHLGLTLRAAGLSAKDAHATGALAHLTDTTVINLPMPVDYTSTDGIPSLTDAAGALRDELVHPRQHGTTGPGGEESLLPDAATEYEKAGATTVEDVENLAPHVTDRVRRLVEAETSTLDNDVTMFLSDDCPLPRLMLLGPVVARTRGEATAGSNRRAYYTELLAYLALHPHGSTISQLAEAFSIKEERMRNDLTVLRKWLGKNPRTGDWHLPYASSPNGKGGRDPHAYKVEDLLCDVDLFRALRARGQARQADGIADLQSALKLVRGEPFTHTRKQGWSWMLEGDRTDQLMTCAIVDVAHIVVTRALDEDDLDLAHTVAEKIYKAAPYEEIPKLDLITVLKAEGHDGQADRILTEEIERRDDEPATPLYGDLPPRTVKIINNHDWRRRGKPGNPAG
ncbi:LysM peptidoglycan-binding domain-containing protein [Georgenia sp. AZ-5]|uniref:LysM peptidoglycan-binding domain-containing protein n=1 Tax=Georgenia sp. AZ-5 TaxID=3367526 RepID=UPI0037551748